MIFLFATFSFKNKKKIKMDIETKKLIENIKKEFELKNKLKEISKPILIKSINKEKDHKKRINLSELNTDNYLNSKRYFYKELKY